MTPEVRKHLKSIEHLNSLSVASVISYYKFSGLQQYTFIFFMLWRSEIRAQFLWANIKVLARFALVLEVRGESLFPCLSQFSRARLYFLAHGPTQLQFQWCSILTSVSLSDLCSHCHISTPDSAFIFTLPPLTRPFCLPLTRTLLILGPSPIIQKNLPISSSLVYSQPQSPLCHVR